jgi:sulfatase modifying factor 1
LAGKRLAGHLPPANDLSDGYLTTAPLRSYAPNGFGLWQTVGNVWEWCADWYDPAYYRRSPRHDPTGPARGTTRVIRGGSFLCHDSYCNRYRKAARSSDTPHSSTANTGFRTVA